MLRALRIQFIQEVYNTCQGTFGFFESNNSREQEKKLSSIERSINLLIPKQSLFPPMYTYSTRKSNLLKRFIIWWVFLSNAFIGRVFSARITLPCFDKYPSMKASSLLNLYVVTYVSDAAAFFPLTSTLVVICVMQRDEDSDSSRAVMWTYPFLDLSL